ncbi:PTS transporter subunit EIIB [Streptomyces sp. NPDC020597]|uniref:PTS transporter subunit EIIB n=1 Tax=unclassified Streptomyces TaxID=2593676 RepID=UPI0037AEFE98
MPAHDDDQGAAAILRGVGGQENVTRLTHCFVRLRFHLRDPAAADIEALTAHPAVAYAVWQLDELHIAPGRDPFGLFGELKDVLGDVASRQNLAGCPAVALDRGRTASCPAARAGLLATTSAEQPVRPPPLR